MAAGAGSDVDGLVVAAVRVRHVDGNFLDFDDHESSVTSWIYEFGCADCKPNYAAGRFDTMAAYSMVEINPRPRKPNLFVQVSVAVISGAAAMYCIQSFHAAGESAAPALRQSSPAIEPNAPQPPNQPAPGAPPPAPALDPGVEPPRAQAAPPAAVSMLIMPEPGGASGGIVSVGEDEPVPGGTAPSAVKKTGSPATPARKETPVIHLQHSGLQSRYTGHIGHDFQSPQLAPRVYPKKEAPKAELAAEALEPKPAPHFIAVPRNLDEKGIPQKDIFVPSSLHPEFVPEQPFWDYERKRKAVFAGLIALSGILYLMSVHGLFTSLFSKARDDS